MINKASVKAGIYFSHYECFGHTSRVIAISQILKKKFPDGNFFFIQAGIDQPTARLGEYGRLYSLPAPLVDRNNFRELKQLAGIQSPIRVQKCLDIIAHEKPDIFLTEFFPLGREESRHELIPAVVKASAQGSQVWAIAGYPLITGAGDGWREKIIDLYKKIIIFAPAIEKEIMADSLPSTLDRQRYLDFFDRHEKKILFAGYLLPEGEILNYKEDANNDIPRKPPGACSIAVVRGGGAYYPKIIAEAIRASEFLGDDYFFSVVAGPATTAEEWYFFSSLLAKKKKRNLALHKSILDYEGLIRNCDVCVSTASYHSAVMLMKYCKKSVVIPFEGYDKAMSFLEQPARARLLNQTIGADILPVKDLTAAALADLIKKAGCRREVKNMDIRDWFTGEQFLDKVLTGLFER